MITPSGGVEPPGRPASSVAIRSAAAGSASRRSSCWWPPSIAQFGSRVVRVVLDAVYGYTSVVTSTPVARAASIAAMARVVLPQLADPITFKCEISSRTALLRAVSTASAIAVSS
ncbi:MAG: hypothetical protein M3Z00_10615 [Actinomycetota bacterium]|nr:hypothetical protein [Actinomycetota bacterium]